LAGDPFELPVKGMNLSVEDIDLAQATSTT
jgi:hypothetical protein